MSRVCDVHGCNNSAERYYIIINKDGDDACLDLDKDLCERHLKHIQTCIGAILGGAMLTEDIAQRRAAIITRPPPPEPQEPVRKWLEQP